MTTVPLNLIPLSLLWSHAAYEGTSSSPKLAVLVYFHLFQGLLWQRFHPPGLPGPLRTQTSHQLPSPIPCWLLIQFFFRQTSYDPSTISCHLPTPAGSHPSPSVTPLNGDQYLAAMIAVLCMIFLMILLMILL